MGSNPTSYTIYLERNYENIPSNKKVYQHTSIRSRTRLMVTSPDGTVRYIKPYPGAGMPPSFVKCSKCGNYYYSPCGFCDCELEEYVHNHPDN